MYAPCRQESLISWASASFFLLAEGNYPYPSSYITYAVASGSPLPAWPMREACRSLSRDFGIHVSGSRKGVNYTAKLGDLEVTVDWTYWSSNGGDLTEEQLKASGILDLATAVTKAAGVWYNVSGGQSCWNIIQAEKQPKHAGHDDPQYGKGHEAGSCSKCPPCADCPACPVSRCAGDDTPCNFTGQVPKTFAWDTIVCNDDLSQISAQGLGLHGPLVRLCTRITLCGVPSSPLSTGPCPSRTTLGGSMLVWGSIFCG